MKWEYWCPTCNRNVHVFSLCSSQHTRSLKRGEKYEQTFMKWKSTFSSRERTWFCKVSANSSNKLKINLQCAHVFYNKLTSTRIVHFPHKMATLCSPECLCLWMIRNNSLIMSDLIITLNLALLLKAKFVFFFNSFHSIRGISKKVVNGRRHNNIFLVEYETMSNIKSNPGVM